MELQVLQGCHALKLEPRACRVVSETPAFDGNSVWIPFYDGSHRTRGSGPNAARGGASSPTARSRTPVINRDGSATFRLGLRSTQALAWLHCGAYSLADVRTAKQLKLAAFD